MFPWVYEFHWTIGHILFLVIFFSVLLSVGLTFSKALWSTWRTIRRGEQDKVLWKADFEDLPPEARACRHELTGEYSNRKCMQEFDCRACENHQSILQAQAAKGRPDTEPAESLPYGFHMPSDRWYHRGHTWVRPEGGGVYSIGLDDFGTRLIGEPDQVELPAPGTRLTANGKAWTMKKKLANIRILSPLDGEVIGRGGPRQGWYLKIRTELKDQNTDHLLHGAEVKAWLLKEVERLQLSLSLDGVGSSLADGGEMVHDVTSQDPHADWDAVLGEMFLEA